MAGKNRAVSPLSNDSYGSNYSDDFEDDDAHNNTRYKTRSPLLRTAVNVQKSASTNRRSVQLRDIEDVTPDTYRTRETISSPRVSRATQQFVHRSNRSNRGRGRGGRFGRGSQMTTGRSSQEPKFDNIAKRVMSARRLKINELKNNNEELNQQIRDLKDENKLLKKTQLRTEKALQRFEDKENDLPQIMQRQQNEVRSYKDQIRKWREKFEKTDRYLRDAEDELEKVKFKLKKLKSVAEEKELPERSELNKRLQKSELDIEERDVKIKELERHLQNIQKNHRHELGIERARQKDTNKKLMELRDENEKLEIVIKEKEKELQMKNIYANRMIKPPHHLPNSYNGTPTPPVKQRRPSLSEGMTPREKAKMMEEKRREDLRKQREAKERNRASHRSNLSDRSAAYRQLSVERSPMRGDREDRSVIHRQLSVERSPIRGDRENVSPRSTQNEQQQKLKREKELRKRQEEEDLERERREAEERERRAWEEKERQLEEEAQREADDRRNREERERLKREAEERERQERKRREIEEQDRREREWKEKQEREKRERREKEERERRDKERLEQERRAREERERMENDEEFQAGKRKKEEILQKLREIDEGVTKDKDDKKKTDHVFITSPRENSMDSQSSKKSYTFSRPTENLHKGKPSHKDLDYPGSPTRKKKDPRRYDIDGLEKGGYNPSFTSEKGASKTKNNLSLFDDTSTTTNTNKTAKKSKLLEDLFGSKDESGSKQNISFDSKPSKTATKSSTRSGFPWDDEVSKNKDFGTKRENSSTLFGGGSALINDEEFQPSSRTTNPRRPKQTTTTFHSGPVVKAIDHGFDDDDLEEVIL